MSALHTDALPADFLPRATSDDQILADQQYQRVLESLAETALATARASNNAAATQRAEDAVVSLRVVGRTLQEVDTSEALAHMIRAVETAADLVELGNFYLRYFVKIFLKSKGRTSTTSISHPSRPSVEQDRVIHLLHMEQGTLSHSDAEQLALERDGCRCL
ncbi:hypothetical protein B0H17DRAFT_1034036, partial [Mycena rosella]